MSASTSNPSLTHTSPVFARSLNRFFRRPWVELTVGILIVVSILLTLVEFALVAGSSEDRAIAGLRPVQVASEVLTWIFVVELLLRLASTWSPRRFLREYWMDVIAVLPSLLPDLVAARLMRLIRLLRILRLFGFMSRVSTSFPYIVRRGIVEYVTVCGLLLMTVLLGTSAMMMFESGQGLSFQEAFWFSVYSLFAGEPVGEDPQSIGGRLVTVFVMFMGVTIFAMFTGTVSAFMVERLRTKGKTVDWEQLDGHVVICGWNTKAEIIIQEYRHSHVSNDIPIVVITEWEHEPPSISDTLRSQVLFVNDDFTRVAALERTGIHRARTCIIMNDTTGGRTEQDADARTILTALTVEKLNRDVYTCAELNNSDYASHLQMGHVNDYVVSSEYSAYMLAQAAMNRGLMDVFNELLTYQRGNQFYRIALPESWHGRSFDDAIGELREQHGAILIAAGQTGSMHVNPSAYTFQPGDEVVVIADHEPRLL